MVGGSAREDTLKQWCDQLCSLVRRRRTYNEVRTLLHNLTKLNAGAWYMDNTLKVACEEIDRDIAVILGEIKSRGD